MTLYLHRPVHKLPLHVSQWMEDREDVLWGMYMTLQDISSRQDPSIMDKADFVSFCSCMARLSRIDHPAHSIAGKTFRPLVHDIYLTENQVHKVDEITNAEGAEDALAGSDDTDSELESLPE